MSIGKRRRAYRIRANHPTITPSPNATTTTHAGIKPQAYPSQAPTSATDPKDYGMAVVALERRRKQDSGYAMRPAPRAATTKPVASLSNRESSAAENALAPPHAEIKPKAYPCPPPTHSTATFDASATPRQDDPILCLNKR